MSGVPSRILIVRLGSLGDVVHAIPAAAALRHHAPQARIDWIVDPRYVAVLEMVRGLDAPIAVDLRRSRGALPGTIRRLRAAQYEAVLDLQGLVKSAVLARLSGGVRTIGFTRPHLREPLAGFFYTEAHEPGPHPHVVFRNLHLLGAVGVQDETARFPLEVPRTRAVDTVGERLGSGAYVLINPGAAWPNKRWPPDRFGALASAVRERTGLRSVVLWGPGEQPLAAAVTAASHGAAVVSPETTIVDLFALAREARLVISGDTGPLHVAGAVGTPVVALFGPTRLERNGPWRAGDVGISRTDRCACLYERRCRYPVPCIDGIGVDEVVAAIDRRLAAHE